MTSWTKLQWDKSWKIANIYILNKTGTLNNQNDNSKLKILITVHRPYKLTQQILRKDWLNFDLICFTPGHSNSRVIVVCFTCSCRNLLVVFFLPEIFYVKFILLYYRITLCSVFFMHATVDYLLSGKVFTKSFPPSIFTF